MRLFSLWGGRRVTDTEEERNPNKTKENLKSKRNIKNEGDSYNEQSC